VPQVLVTSGAMDLPWVHPGRAERAQRTRQAVPDRARGSIAAANAVTEQASEKPTS